LKIEAIWKELEQEAQHSESSGWLTRHARPNPVRPLLVALEIQQKRRALLLPLSDASVPSKRDWPQCRGLEIFSGTMQGEVFLGVRLQDPADSEVFAALAEDIAARVADARSASEAVGVLLGRLRRWQKFLSFGSLTLGPQAVKALYGELTAMHDLLIPSLGVSEGVHAWVGPQRASQDFQLPRIAFEVKTTASKGPQIVTISSERQLDTTGIERLFLYVLSLDERVTTGTDPAVGQTLPELVDSIRQLVRANDLAAEHLEDRLLEARYRAADCEQYQSQRFAVREEHIFEVTKDFPRIVEGNLAEGLGEVTYSLSLSACAPFAVSREALTSTLTS
jgi:hypothetical protein